MTDKPPALVGNESLPVSLSTQSPQRLVPTLTAGLLIGVLTTMRAISMAALIFAGPLAGDVAGGIGLTLWSAAAMSLVVALLSARSGIVAYPQEAPAAVIAVAAAATAGQMGGADSAARLATVMALIALTALLTGAAFWALGQFRLGDLMRYLPYPVVGGFLAGTGWLLTVGAIGVMAGVPPSLALFEPATLIHWAPGVVFGVVLLLLMRRFKHFLILPAMVFSGIAAFYAVLWASGLSPAEAAARGWLLGPFPGGGLWQPLTPATLGLVEWPVILGQFDKILTAIVIAVIGMLLNGSGLELALRQDLDLNHELRIIGVANAVAGLGGGPSGFHGMSLSVLASRIGASSRLVGLIAAGVALLALALGSAPLAYVPRVVLGGALLYLGLAFLAEWLYDAWFRLPHLDYTLVVAIMVTIGLVGLLQGIVLGLAVAVVLFVVSYSRVDVVKHSLSGSSLKSRVNRAPAEQQALREHGEQVFVLQLQGFIFFGTASSLVERVRRRVAQSEQPALRFVILDFRQVAGLDSTASVSFIRLQQLAQTQRFTLILAGLPGHVGQRLVRAGFPDTLSAPVEVLPDLDRALELCENAIIRAELGETLPIRPLFEQLQTVAPEAEHILAMLSYFERRMVEPGAYLMRQGDAADELYFIEQGQVTAQIEPAGGLPVRLESVRGGRIVGELGFYRNSPRTAAVVADEPTLVYRLGQADLTRMEQEAPEAAATFHLIVARLLAERVVHLVGTVDALQR